MIKEKYIESANNPKVSVIVPVYNTEEYVKQAIDSISQQTLFDIEIIVINDGSIDNSLSILHELANADNRIRVYSQHNQGQAAARNHGLKYAAGKYIYLMDSDDLLEEDALDICYSKCEKNELDFVFFDARMMDVENSLGLKYNRKAVTDESRIYRGVEIQNILLNKSTYYVPIWLNFIRKSYLQNMDLWFRPDIYHEDELFTFIVYLHARKVMCIHRNFFIRRLRPNSTMTTPFVWKNMSSYLAIAKDIEVLRKGAGEEEKKAIDTYLFRMLNGAVWKSHSLPVTKRLYVFGIYLFKYGKFIIPRIAAALLFKSSIFHSNRHDVKH